MKKNYLTPLFIFMISTMVIGCGGEKVMSTAPSFEPYQFDANQYSPKVDNFMVILDTSSSMADRYQGQAKDAIAKNFLVAMNKTLPELKYNSALRTFGHDAYLPDRSTMLVYDVKSYSTSGFESAVKGVKGPGGDTSVPLAKAITDTGKDFATSEGPVMLIIVSDGVDMDQAPVKAAEALKKQFGDRICIDTVQVGDDPDGKEILEQISEASGCGHSTNADRLAVSSSMAGFVEGLFLAKPALDPIPMAASPKPVDSDNDGVSDNLDQCPNTPMKATVDATGCWTHRAIVLFDHNSSYLTSAYYDERNKNELNKLGDFLKEHPKTQVVLSGYTDDTGSDEYNLWLSERRAKRVQNFLTNYSGIRNGRIITRWYGKKNPVDSNSTEEGKQQNRRVESIVIGLEEHS